MRKGLYIIVFTLNLVCILPTLAQQSTGLLSSKERYSRVPQMEVTGEKFNNLPLKVSLKKYCPVVGDQRTIGACVGWSTGYGAMTILMAQKLGLSKKEDITERAFSAAFIYNQIKVKSDNCNEGAYLEDALDLLKTKGDCLEKNFNYEKNTCLAMPHPKLVNEAATFKIKDYAAVFQLDEAGKSKIAKACKILSKEMPIVVGMGITPSFWNIKSGATLWNPDNTEGVSGNHAMLLVGYDNVEKEFDLMNSFGPAWGKNGYIKIKFDDFERLCKYAYLLMPNDSKTPENDIVEGETKPKIASPPLSGAFVFRRPAGYLTTADGDEVPYFEEIITQFNSTTGIYEPVENAFEVGDAFQLVARKIPRGRYAYVFSQSPSGRVNLHYPKKKVANFVIDEDIEIVIPSEESILQIPESGDDYLCIVYTNAPIVDFEKRFIQMQTEGDFKQKIKAYFGDLLTPAHLVQFEENKMAFSATPSNEKMAVAMILKVSAK